MWTCAGYTGCVYWSNRPTVPVSCLTEPMPYHRRIRHLVRLHHWCNFGSSWGLTACIIAAYKWGYFDLILPAIVLAGLIVPFIFIALDWRIARARRAQWWHVIEEECAEETTPLAFPGPDAGGRRASGD